MSDCVFCEIVAGRTPATILHAWPDAISIVPLDPVAEGHRLILPRFHVETAATDPAITAAVAHRAAQTLHQGEHLAANTGSGAGQTVFHLHLHAWPCQGGAACMPWGCPDPLIRMNRPARGPRTRT